MLKTALGSDLQTDVPHGNANTREAMQLSKYPDYFVFGFVRNPWERMLSWYRLIHKWSPGSVEHDRMQFQQFLESDGAAAPSDTYFHYNQLDYFPEGYRDLGKVQIFRYEDYNNEVNRLIRQLGLPPMEITRHNGTRSVDHHHYYTEESVRWVRQHCARDISHFNYTFQ